jgi:hypothetical protein
VLSFSHQRYPDSLYCPERVIFPGRSRHLLAQPLLRKDSDDVENCSQAENTVNELTAQEI